MIPALAGEEGSERDRSQYSGTSAGCTICPNSTWSSAAWCGGGMGIRTPDPDLAKVVLYQLSYAPRWGAGVSRLECARV
jgi:hypothetical protein